MTKSEVEQLITKAANSDKADDALKFSQSACNIANAIRTLKETEKTLPA